MDRKHLAVQQSVDGNYRATQHMHPDENANFKNTEDEYSFIVQKQLENYASSVDVKLGFSSGKEGRSPLAALTERHTSLMQSQRS